MSDDHEPTAEEIVAEAERRLAARQQEPAPLSPLERRTVVFADRVIYWFARHWLVLANLAALLYAGLPALAPVLMHWGLTAQAQVIYALYRPLCHQLPFRSWFFFGPQWSYSMTELSRLVGPEALVQHGYIGDATLGFKMAYCQRDTAIYTTLLVAGLLYGLTGRRLRPMSGWAYVLIGLVPIGLDGGLQFFSYALPLLAPSWGGIPLLESSPCRRTVTGALFGLATVWLAYPILQETIADIIETLEKRFGWESNG